MPKKSEIKVLKTRIILLSFVFNPGAVILGVAFYHYLLGKEIPVFSYFPYSIQLAVLVGSILILVNFWFVLKFQANIKRLQGVHSGDKDRVD